MNQQSTIEQLPPSPWPWRIGVDGGGTGTRAVLVNAQGKVVGRGNSGPSALGQGIEAAQRAITEALSAAFADAGLSPAPAADCAVALGLSGANHTPWREALAQRMSHFGRCVVDTDGLAMLTGAFGGQAGVLMAAGTGSVAEVLRDDGSRASAGGWGFPVADEGSGAWLGLKAVALAQMALDGRGARGPLAEAVLQRIGPGAEQVLTWCAQARQFEYATLARLVFECSDMDADAENLLQEATQHLVRHIDALDSEGRLALVVSGSVGESLARRLPETYARRRQSLRWSPAEGAVLWLGVNH